MPQKFIPKLIQLYRDGLFPFDRLVKFYDFAGINRAIADSKRGTTIKPVLLMCAGQRFGAVTERPRLPRVP